MDSPEISSKIKSAIKAKLVELDSYVDDELPGEPWFHFLYKACSCYWLLICFLVWLDEANS